MSDLRTYTGSNPSTKGLFLINEYHPFRRIWKGRLRRWKFAYFDNGGTNTLSPGMSLTNTKQFEFHWTVSEYLRAVIEQGVELIRFEEIGDEAEGWEGAPLQGLPQKLLIAGRKS